MHKELLNALITTILEEDVDIIEPITVEEILPKINAVTLEAFNSIDKEIINKALSICNTTSLCELAKIIINADDHKAVCKILGETTAEDVSYITTEIYNNLTYLA